MFVALMGKKFLMMPKLSWRLFTPKLQHRR